MLLFMVLENMWKEGNAVKYDNWVVMRARSNQVMHVLTMLHKLDLRLTQRFNAYDLIVYINSMELPQ